MRTRNNDGVGIFSCGCWIAVLVFNLLAGGWSINFILNLLGKNIPFFWDTVIGLFTAEITVPLAVIVWILKQFAVL